LPTTQALVLLALPTTQAILNQLLLALDSLAVALLVQLLLI
jgi:hypothetical protein